MLRRYRVFLLLALAGLLAWLNVRAPADVEVVKATERAAVVGISSASYGALPLARPMVSMAAAERLERPMLEPAARDPFVMEVQAPVVSPKPPAPLPPPPVVMAAPVTPSMPPLSLRFAGRMRTPEGEDVVYMADGDNSLAITVGQSLPNGYRVEAITAKAVELRYLPSNVTTRLELPEPPKYEIR